jgi:transposase
MIGSKLTGTFVGDGSLANSSHISAYGRQNLERPFFGRKRHILVDTLGIPIAGRVEAASMSDRRAAACLLGCLGPIFPTIKTVIADADHQSCKLTRLIKAEGYELRIVKRRERAFEVVGLTWIVERTFAWIGRYRRMSKDYEHRVKTSETLIDLIAIRLMLNRLTKS